MRRRCGKSSCHCAFDEKAWHVSLYLATTINGKRRSIYIPSTWEDRVREWVERHKQIKDILEEISSNCLRRVQKRED
jgi:hypothetical protein